VQRHRGPGVTHAGDDRRDRRRDGARRRRRGDGAARRARRGVHRVHERRRHHADAVRLHADDRVRGWHQPPAPLFIQQPAASYQLPHVNPRELSERALHEYVAEVEGHDSQVTGVVGYFYAMYRAEVLKRVAGIPGRDILEVGCGEGMMFDGTGTRPVQMDVSMTRVAPASGEAPRVLLADG